MFTGLGAEGEDFARWLSSDLPGALYSVSRVFGERLYKMEQITLKSFIKNALVDIGEAINEANQHFINPKQSRFHVFSLRHNKGDQINVPGIQFDVAITAVNNKKGKAGLMVTVLPLNGGVNTEISANNELIHRIKFEIGIQDTFIGDVPGRE